MSIPNTGPLRLSDLASLFGGNTPYRLSQFYRGAGRVPNVGTNSNVPASGRIGLQGFRGAVNELVLTNTGTIQNVNVRNVFDSVYGTPTTSVVVRYINNGTIGSLDSSLAALRTGSFPSGSQIIIENNGNIYGASGLAGISGVGGTGGTAILSEGSNQSVLIINSSSGQIYAGGGGGGRGGNGGNGTFNQAVNLGNSSGNTLGFGGTATSSDSVCVVTYGSGAFCGSGASSVVENSTSCSFCQCTSFNQSDCAGCGPCPVTTSFSCVTCQRIQEFSSTGGTAGVGGRGQGFTLASVAGSNGAVGGTNAGTGGRGGNGGGWGSNGANGSTGSNGNVTLGLAGSAGGLAGFYLNRVNVNTSLTNNGAVLGRLQ